jgi:hypothetical protein
MPPFAGSRHFHLYSFITSESFRTAHLSGETPMSSASASDAVGIGPARTGTACVTDTPSRRDGRICDSGEELEIGKHRDSSGYLSLAYTCAASLVESDERSL